MGTHRSGLTVGAPRIDDRSPLSPPFATLRAGGDPGHPQPEHRTVPPPGKRPARPPGTAGGGSPSHAAPSPSARTEAPQGSASPCASSSLTHRPLGVPGRDGPRHRLGEGPPRRRGLRRTGSYSQQRRRCKLYLGSRSFWPRAPAAYISTGAPKNRRILPGDRLAIGINRDLLSLLLRGLSPSGRRPHQITPPIAPLVTAWR